MTVGEGVKLMEDVREVENVGDDVDVRLEVGDVLNVRERVLD